MRCTLECVSRWQIGWLLTAILMIPVLIYLSTVVLKTPVKTTRPAVDKIGRQKLESDGLETHSRTIESPQVETRQAEPVKKCDDDSSVKHSSSVSDHTLSVKEQMHGSTTLHNTILTTSFGELTDMVSGLQNDKLKLQKLVITQKAVMDTLRQRYQKAQVMTQDGLAAMRKDRAVARAALRVARRERDERLRLEADNAEIRKQLASAMSASPEQ